MPDRHVRRSGSDYAFALSSLLPFGIAWPREYGSVLQQTVRGLANVWGFVDGRAADLLERESDPRATLEMLEDWERAYGLPDKCLNEPQGITARRNALLHRITTIGAQSRQFFIDEARSLGYDIAITEYSCFQAGVSRVGYTKGYNLDKPSRYRWYLGPPEMRFFWTVDVGKIALFYFHCAAGQCGIDPLLRNGRATDLECLINREKPAHTLALFDYSHLRTKISPAAAQLTLSPVAPTKVYSRDPKKISPTSRDLILSPNPLIRGKQTTFTSSSANRLLSLNAPFVRVGVPMILKTPTSRDLAISTVAPTVTGGWTPLALGAALRGWYRADAGVITVSGLPPVNGDPILTWQDQSGNGQHLSRNTTSPTFISSTSLNGKPTISMDSAGAFRSAAGGFNFSSTSGPNLSVFALAAQTANINGGLVSFTGSGQANDYDNTDSMTFSALTNTSISAYRNNLQLSTITVPTNKGILVGTVFASGINVSYLNGALWAPSTSSTNNFANTGTLTVGSGYQANAPGRFWQNLISEVIVTNSAMSSVDVDNLYQYFRRKYGL